jgi:hypothetical protein
MTDMDWSERLSRKEVVGYLVVVALLAVASIFLGQYIYPALGLSFLLLPGGRGSIAPFVFGWTGVLLVLLAIPFFRKRGVLLALLSIGGGTVLAAIGLLWLARQ